MNILWYSSTPQCSAAYGNVTRYMIRWLREQGHTILVATKHARAEMTSFWDGFEIIEGTALRAINKEIKRREIDYSIAFFDIWTLKKPYLDNMVTWIPIDTQIVSEEIIKVARQAKFNIAMTQHGLNELGRWKLDPEPLYAPLGVNMDIFKPDPEGGRKFRESFGWTEKNFVIGSVGANYGDDRKGYIILLKAFREFINKHPEARLYLHTQAFGDDCCPYSHVIDDLGLNRYVGFPDQQEYFFDRISEEALPSIYSGFDVFCLPTKGEGFGLPVIEAQACGVPVVVTDNTSGPELCKTGRLIDIDELDDSDWTIIKTWRVIPKASAVLKALEEFYRTPIGYATDTLEEMIRYRVMEYNWSNVWKMYWQPILDMFERSMVSCQGN